MRNALLAILLVPAVAFGGDWYTDDAVTPSKVDQKPLPPGANSSKYIRGSDWNSYVKAPAELLRAKVKAHDSTLNSLVLGAPNANDVSVTSTGGTTARSLASRFSDVVNVKDYESLVVGGDWKAAIDEAARIAAASGKRLVFPPGDYTHALPIVIAASSLEMEGVGAATLTYTGDTAFDGVKITPAADEHGDRLVIRGLKFHGGKAALHIEGSLANTAGGYIYSNVLVEGNTIRSSIKAALWLTHVRDARIVGNVVISGADNGIYTEYSEQIVIDGNNVIDCAGSGAITVGYSDGTLPSRSIVISNNVVDVTENAGGATHLAGIDVVYATDVDVVGNLIVSRSASYPIKSGITVEEFTLRNIQIRNNTIIDASERGIRVGTNANSAISKLAITGNVIRTRDSGLDGIQIQRSDDVEIAGNLIEGWAQNGINADGTASNLRIYRNTIRDVGTQDNWAGSSGSVKSSAPRTEVAGNTFVVGSRGGVLTSSATSPTATVDTTTTPRTLSLRYNAGANVAATIDLTGLTWGQLATAVSAVALPSPGAWSLALATGASGHAVEPIRRTGTRNGNDVAATPIPAEGLYVGIPEPYSFVTLTGAAGRVARNSYTLPSGFNPPQPFAAASSNYKYVLDVSTEADVTGAGATSLVGATLTSPVASSAGIAKLAVSTSASAAQAQSVAMANESLRLHNLASDHARLTDGTNEWGLNINGSTGLRINRLSGAGTVSIANGLKVYGGKLSPPTSLSVSQSSGIFMGSGVPDSGAGADGDVYFRTDTPGTANQRIYIRSGGAWVGIL